MENVSVPNFGTENNWLHEIEEVFQERNELFKSWEERIEERKKELLEREEKVRVSERESAERAEKLLEEQQRLEEKKKGVEELLAIQEKNKVELEEKSKHIIREKIDLEKRKNQYLSMDTCRGKDTENSVCLEDYILRTEVEEKYIPIEEHQRQIKEVKEEAFHEAFNRALSVIVPNNSKTYSPILEEADRETEETYADKEEVQCEQAEEEVEQIIEEEVYLDEDEMEISEVKEELTASVLKNYIEKNPSGFTFPEILHSEGEDQLRVTRGTLEYRFIFDNPCYFDIIAERKEGKRLRNIITQLNQEYPKVKFRFNDGKIVATTYFSNKTPAHELISEVEEISQLFKG